MFRNVLITTALLFAVCIVGFAAEKSYNANGFSMKYDESWNLVSAPSGFSMKPPSGTIRIDLSVTTVKKKVKAAVVLKKAELDNGWKNELGKITTMTKSDRKSVGADTGAMGMYQFDQQDEKIKTMIIVMTKGKKVFTMTLVVVGEPSSEETSQYNKIGESIRLSK